MHFEYKTEGTCARQISFDMENGTVSNIQFFGGCAGNLTAIPKLIDGWSADEIAEKLLGNECGGRPTSCTDQLAKAVLAAKKKEAEAS